MAGALGVALEKIGHYHLGADQLSPVAQDIARAVRLVYSTTALSVGILIGVMLILAV
jgi:cobalamin biosynthesis protein CobD/CbiB